MKNNHPILLLLLAAAWPLAGCAKERAATPVNVAQAETSPTAPAVPPAPAAPDKAVVPAAATDPCVEMKLALERASFDAHTGLSEIQQRMDRDIDVRVAAKKAAADVSLAADSKLDTATHDFAEKLRMLTVATSETWESAKHDTELSLQNVCDAFSEVMRSPARK